MQILLDTKAAAPLAGADYKTLQNWRVQGFGPAFIKVGRKVMYDPADIAAWKASRRVQSTSEALAA